MSDEKRPNYIEKAGKGGGDRIAALEAEMESARRLLQPLADDLTDAFQATIAVAAGERLQDDESEHDLVTAKDAVERHIVKVGFDPRRREYVAKFLHHDDTYLLDAYDADASHTGRVKYTDMTLAASQVTEAAVEAAKCQRKAAELKTANIRYEDHGNDFQEMHGNGGMGWQQYSSPSLNALLSFLNREVLSPAHSIDASKYKSADIGQHR